ncbi:hypothetical protein BGP77_15805 [Saccharospirillum sp. MSK14-1]|uniref:TetR/AcrR family transcriptional regulator n=1 Tax=Saccharospirillum sp. MSK14-1 TaxID=1897632 RepID=UPI000D37668F|nr:TetR/AcrR family transcriptional regulator [Saccharospirillum sp. MSK14-1]PTY37924.1 hypothetical protein BGP77_15805 [Saccharospirillum sp. MSK14-1]
MSATPPQLKARKLPVQARSAHTLTVIFDATVQVLLRDGYSRLTTTRVAERAGVSVGSLYQYFPNKEALLAAVMGRHLDHIGEAMEQACIAGKGQDTATMAAQLVDGFMDAKLDQVGLSRALYQLPMALGRDEQAAQTTERCARAIHNMLASRKASLEAQSMAVFVVTTCLIGPMQTLLTGHEPTPENVAALRVELKQLLLGYLQQLLGETKPQPHTVNDSQ